MTRIHIFQLQGKPGFYWDDAEDHGGFDRNVPCGPFPNRMVAQADAAVCCGAITVEDTDLPPARYFS